MQVTLENDGERKEVQVDQNGRVYIGTKYEGQNVELAFEVQE